MSRLLDDQPVDARQDRLRLARYLDIIDDLVLRDSRAAPFVVGVFGRWGTGKTSLLKMLAERLAEESKRIEDEWKKRPRRPTFTDVLNGLAEPGDWYRGLTAEPPQSPGPERPFTWRLVQFSPWMYRHEKTLLLPLLAILAKSDSAFKGIIQDILALTPKLVETLKDLGLEAAQAGLPLLTFLSSIRKPKPGKSIQELSDRIADAVSEITGRRERLVFLIDDLDRCHDPEQVVGLLEQIKLFLHLEHCLFFIFADRGHILAAIEKRYPGEGVSYLEKFVQLSIDLPPHDSPDLAGLLPLDPRNPDDKPHLPYWERLAETLGHNPRRLKKLWNRTLVCLDLVLDELDRPPPPGSTVERHRASRYLMAKWLLMMEHGFLGDPYVYLGFEALSPSSDARSPIEEAREHFLGIGEQELTAERRRVLMFLWHERDAHRYEHPAVVSLYARSAGMTLERPRAYLEEAAFAGKRQFRSMDFSEADLRGAVLSGLSFSGCDFRYTRFDEADLRACRFEECFLDGGLFKAARLANTRFRACELLDACFDDAEVEGTSWIRCRNIDGLKTDARTYEAIADIMAEQWRNGGGEPWAGAEHEQLYRTYQIVVLEDRPKPEVQRTLSEEDRAKAKRLRDEVEAANASPGTGQE